MNVDEGTEGAMNFVPKRRLLLPTPTWQEDKAYSDFFADGVAASRKVHSRSRKDAILTTPVKCRPSLQGATPRTVRSLDASYVPFNSRVRVTACGHIGHLRANQ
jgi:hypothetical protein